MHAARACPQVNERLRGWDAAMGRGRGGRGPGSGMGPGRGWGPGAGLGPGRGVASRLGEQNGGDAQGAGFRDRDAAAGPSYRGAAVFRNETGHRDPEFRPRQPPSQVH